MNNEIKMILGNVWFAVSACNHKDNVFAQKKNKASIQVVVSFNWKCNEIRVSLGYFLIKFGHQIKLMSIQLFTDFDGYFQFEATHTKKKLKRL